MFDNNRDWETSDKSMRYLEERIKKFMSKTGDPEERLYAPKLSRFEGSVSTIQFIIVPLIQAYHLKAFVASTKIIANH